MANFLRKFGSYLVPGATQQLLVQHGNVSLFDLWGCNLSEGTGPDCYFQLHNTTLLALVGNEKPEIVIPVADDGSVAFNFRDAPYQFENGLIVAWSPTAELFSLSGTHKGFVGGRIIT